MSGAGGLARAKRELLALVPLAAEDVALLEARGRRCAKKEQDDGCCDRTVGTDLFKLRSKGRCPSFRTAD